MKWSMTVVITINIVLLVMVIGNLMSARVSISLRKTTAMTTTINRTKFWTIALEGSFNSSK